MAKKGRHDASPFSKLVSPLGKDAEETPTYSPDRAVTGANIYQDRKASQTESARNERRGS